MPEDPASLQNLHDIVVPAPPPLWPPAPGVWVLLVISLAILTALALWLWRRHQRNAYRRAGLTLLDGVRSVREVNIVLKRVALAVWPRAEVAPLYGETWTAFLDESCPRTHFGSLAGEPDEAEPSRDLRHLARSWINHHRAPDRKRG